MSHLSQRVGCSVYKELNKCINERPVGRLSSITTGSKCDTKQETRRGIFKYPTLYYYYYYLFTYCRLG